MPQLRPHLPWRTFFTGFSCPSPCHSYAHTCPSARILCGFRVHRHATATPTPAPAHLFYMVFVSTAMPQIRPHLPQRTYFTWFSCPPPCHSYAHTCPGARFSTWCSCPPPCHSYAHTCPG